YEALHLRDEFLSIASHELKTPITSIKAFAQLLNRQADLPANERLRRGLQTIVKQSDQLTTLINELLDVSRIESGRLALDLEPIDLSELLPEVIGPMLMLAETHPIQVEIPPPSPVVLGDRERLRQVLVNLLENGIKYSPEGGAIEVWAGTDAGRALIAVRDHGIGIPADQIPRIFERFYRARNAAMPHYSGLGLGLHISHEIARRHGGDL